MLKFSFWLLLAANIVLFLFSQSYAVPTEHEKREPERMLFQFNPEQIQLLSESGDKKNNEPVKVAENTQKPPESQAQPGVVQTLPSDPKPSESSQLGSQCIVVGVFETKEASDFEKRLNSLSLAAKDITRIPVYEKTGQTVNHIVYIPSQGSKKNTDKRIADLKKSNIGSYHVIQDKSDLQGAISLGIFKTEEAANKFAATLKNQGINDTQVGTRNRPSSQPDKPVEKIQYQINNLNENAIQVIDNVLKEFTKQTKQKCKPS